MSFSTGQTKFDPHELTVERVRHVYRRRTAGWLAHAVSGAFLLMVLWPTFGYWTLVWYAGFLAAHGGQWYLGRLKDDGERLAVPLTTVRPHRVLACIAGAAWGVVGVALPCMSAMQVPMVVVLIVVATVVSLPRLAAMPDIFLSFAACAMAPMMVSAFWLPLELRHLVWLVVGLVSALLAMSAKAVEDDLMDVVVKRLNLERMAWEDKLTGLANRRRFDVVLAEEWRRASRMNVPLSLLLLDVDHFKRFNDTYGHTSGDACLTLVGGVLASHIRRAGDFAGRYGGEEFVVLLFHTSRADALHLAEKVRQAVHSLHVDHSGSPHGVVTVSIGGATVVPSPDTSPELLVDRADDALYEAKEAGRDRVVWSDALL